MVEYLNLDITIIPITFHLESKKKRLPNKTLKYNCLMGCIKKGLFLFFFMNTVASINYCSSVGILILFNCRL